MVHRHRKSEPELLSDDVAGRLQSSDHHPGRKPEHEADCELAREQKEHRLQARARRQQRASKREQHEREQKRQGEPYPRRDHLLADPGHQHDGRAHPREGEHERRRDLGNQEVHRRAL
jgi:hypothetical protein